MALIKCPECGIEVSDKALACPKCAFPIADSKPDGVVRIKMSVIAQTLSGNQRATISLGGKILWEGRTGEIAEIHLDGATNVYIKYHTNAVVWGAECEGLIDPAAGKKYAIQKVPGIFKASMRLQRVDIIDSD